MAERGKIYTRLIKNYIFPKKNPFIFIKVKSEKYGLFVYKNVQIAIAILLLSAKQLFVIKKSLI